jgi:16S rRNA G966 N2-methylase RsmD
MRIVGTDGVFSHDYRPTPRRLVRWVLDGLPVPFDQTTFLDIGSGRGRVLFEAARHPFQRIIGIECAEELQEDASLNLRHWPRAMMRCREVDLVLGNALDEPLPESDLVVWIFDPFAEHLLTRMAARLAEHATRWNVTVVLIEPRGQTVFDQSPTFKTVELPSPLRRRIAMLSPYPIAIFAAGPQKDV